MKLNNIYFIIYVSLVVVMSCSTSKKNSVATEACNSAKIKFNIANFDKMGFLRVDDIKNPIDYEFCVPNKPEILKTINEIDSSIYPMKGKGRTKCDNNAILLTGNSYNKDIKKILCKLSQLSYVTEINQVFWE